MASAKVDDAEATASGRGLGAGGDLGGPTGAKPCPAAKESSILRTELSDRDICEKIFRRWAKV